MYVKLKDNFKKGKYGDEGGVLYMNDNEQQIYDQVSQKIKEAYPEVMIPIKNCLIVNQCFLLFQLF